MKKVWRVLAVVLLTGTVVALWLRPSVKVQSAEPPAAEPKPILLANRTVDPVQLPMPSTPPRASLSRRGTCAYAVQCAHPVSAAVRARVSALGARVIAFIPRNALLIEATPTTVRRLLATDDVSAAVAYEPTDKMPVGLTGGRVTVIPLAESDREVLADFIAANGGTVETPGPSRHGSFRAEVSDELLQKLALRGDVRWIERHVRPQVANNYATVDTGVQSVWNAHGLTGRGQVIATADSGLDTGDMNTMHADLAKHIVRVVNLGGYTYGDYNGHGTHTAGTLAGDGTLSSGKYRGVAWEAKLVVQTCGDKSGGLGIHFNYAETYDDIYAGGIADGAYIHSDSWGSDTQGAYNEMCVGLDDVQWCCPELLVVASSGNAGSGRQTVGSPAAAKNVLAVGNVYSSRSTANKGTIYSQSSRGPCADGRIKPDIAAPGVNIVSAKSSLCSRTAVDTYYTKMSGTSMSAPHAAGCAALVRQWLMERRGFVNPLPTAALVKAVLMGGAKGTVPDNNVGWGRLALEETLYPSNRAVRLIDRMPYSHGTALAYTVTTTNEAPLDVQLCWIDCPGDPSAAVALVNDLDLVVSNKATGAAWFGNAVDGGDRVNNNESVRIPSAPAGEYAVLVNGANVPYDISEGGAAALYVRGACSEEGEDEMVTLTVSVPSRTGLASWPSPAVGAAVYPKGSTLLLSSGGAAVNTNIYGTVLSQFPAVGFTGTGSVPAAGTEDELLVVLDEDSTINWRYADTASAHRLRFSAYNPGNDWYVFADDEGYVENYVVTDAWWVPSGEEVTVSIPDDLALGDSYDYTGEIWYYYPYHRRFYSYEGSLTMRLGEVELAEPDMDGVMCYDMKLRMAKSYSFTMDRAWDVTGFYYDETQTWDSVLPLWWFYRYLGGSYYCGLITTGASQSGGDPDGDGFNNGREYAEGTDPVDDASFRFRIDGFTSTNMVFTGSVKGKLIVERSETTNGEWIGILTNDAKRTSVDNEVSLPSGVGSGFYRVIYTP